MAADSSEEEAENGPTTSPAGYTDDLSPTARQLARVMEICGTCATDKLGADPDNGGSLLMRMAPQGPAKVSEGPAHPPVTIAVLLPAFFNETSRANVCVRLSVCANALDRARCWGPHSTNSHAKCVGRGGREGGETYLFDQS